MNSEFDIHSILREVNAQKQALAEQLPTEQDCIRMMIQCRQRLIDIGWKSGEYAPKDGRKFTGINAGFSGPSEFTHLGSGFFVASDGDWWPVPQPFVFKDQS